ncbi:pentapeptide repeat-containing protein [Streptomyces sp. NPDC051098]|uniref:pentapeptide repeat-containing protein n=1 Tax=Streptomyces sp. NPDC051098 TaxID=3155411 RepID=UPI00343D0636
MNFRGATFSGGMVSFARTKISGGTVSFDGATFSLGAVYFSGATFSGGRVSFSGATFCGSEVYFGSVTVAGGAVSFDGAIGPAPTGLRAGVTPGLARVILPPSWMTPNP